MSRLGRGRSKPLVLALIGCALAAPGCGGSGQTSGGTATVLMGTPPDYLDPQLSYTTQGAEATWISYTPLLTYKHQGSPGGNSLIPGLAQSLPQTSPDARTYYLTLRRGLVYSNGEPVRASDFPYTIERAIRLNWGGKSFFTDNIVGADDYDAGRAKGISGITADDSTGQIAIHLKQPYGPFANVLALPAAGLVPRGTPMMNLSDHPPPGVGAYLITAVSPNRGWTMVKNPRFDSLDIPGIPTGDLNRIVVRIESDQRRAVEQVLQSRADNFDPGTPLPASTIPHVQSVAGDRFEPEPIASTLYFFMNTTIPPFSNELARRAVVTALDRTTLARLSGGLVRPSCYLLPEGIAGHPGDSCPFGDAQAEGDRAAGRLLVHQSGTAGEAVTVWGENRPPERAYSRYYARLLDRLGYRATVRLAPASAYFKTVGSDRTNPQTGFASWFNDFPNPSDFYRLVDADSIQPTQNTNLGRVRDVFIQQQLQKLNLVPAQELSSAAGEWRDLDEYTAKKSYAAVFGTQELPKLMGDRIDFGAAVFHPLFFNDWSTWSLNPVSG
jgi:peptide/nickel transport system substrate-binding protein